MSLNRKIRFTVLMLSFVLPNIGIWVAHRFYGLSLKQMGKYLLIVAMVDIGGILLFAGLGFLTAYLLAFRPHALIHAIERSLAKNRNHMT